MHDSLINEHDLSGYLGRDVTNDSAALFAVEAANDIVRDEAGQPFNRVVGGTAVLDGSGTDALVLPNQPVSQAGTVLVNGTAVTDYVLKDNGVLVRRGTLSGNNTYYDCSFPRVWPAGRQNIEVTYDHGYAEGDIPASVRAVALAVASRLIVQGVAVEESLGDARVKYAGPATDLTAGEKRILRKYRRT